MHHVNILLTKDVNKRANKRVVNKRDNIHDSVKK